MLLIPVGQPIKLSNRPIEHIVMLETFSAKEPIKQIPKMLVIGLVMILQVTKVVHVSGKLGGQIVAEFGDRDRLLPLENKRMSFPPTAGFQTLPGERPTEEVQDHIPQRLEIVTPRRSYMGPHLARESWEYGI